mmetsp:Transcript_40426/g.114475  ORF Transcript_40426/g.114475 Transcript_40426/m.114475 type:complete len:211 (-) Transcript_40426:19-651(-)
MAVAQGGVGARQGHTLCHARGNARPPSVAAGGAALGPASQVQIKVPARLRVAGARGLVGGRGDPTHQVQNGYLAVAVQAVRMAVLHSPSAALVTLAPSTEMPAKRPLRRCRSQQDKEAGKQQGARLQSPSAGQLPPRHQSSHARRPSASLSWPSVERPCRGLHAVPACKGRTALLPAPGTCTTSVRTAASDRITRSAVGSPSSSDQSSDI